MPSDTAVLPTPAPRRLRPQWAWALPVVVVVVAVAAVIAPRAFVDRSMVDRVSFANSTVYAIDVQVTGEPRDGWLPLGRAERGTTTEIDDVIDQGAVWIFHFASQGRDGGELRLARDDLARSGWKVAIPVAVADRLASRGASATPVPTDS